MADVFWVHVRKQPSLFSVMRYCQQNQTVTLIEVVVVRMMMILTLEEVEEAVVVVVEVVYPL